MVDVVFVEVINNGKNRSKRAKARSKSKKNGKGSGKKTTVMPIGNAAKKPTDDAECERKPFYEDFIKRGKKRR